MSLVVRNDKYIAVDDRFVKLDNRVYATFHSGRKLFVHPSHCLVLSPLGDNCGEVLCEELLHLAHNELFHRYNKGEVGTVPSMPVGVMLRGTKNYINEHVTDNKKDTTFFLFLKELTIVIKKIMTNDNVPDLLCRELYVPDIVAGSGEQPYQAAIALGCTLKQAFQYAHQIQPTVGPNVTCFRTSQLRSYLDRDRHE